MRKCVRCGDQFPVRTAADRYCGRCANDVAGLLIRKPVNGPAWLSRLQAKDMTRRAA